MYYFTVLHRVFRLVKMFLLFSIMPLFVYVVSSLTCNSHI